MSAAAMKALMMLLKKVAADVLTDPEKLLKYILIAVMVFVVIIVVIISPIIFAASLPTVLFKIENMPEDILKEQTEIVELYKDIVTTAAQENNEWIQNQKNRYSWCDDIVVNNDFTLGWYELMAIDTIRLEQDFSNAQEKDIIDIADEFIITNTYTSTYEEPVTSYRVKKDEKGNIVLDDKGKPVMESYPDTVTRDRAHISVEMRELDDVLDRLNYDKEKKDIIKTIYDNIKSVDKDGNFDNVNWST